VTNPVILTGLMLLLSGYRGVTELLIKAGASLEAKQNQGVTALMSATQNGHG